MGPQGKSAVTTTVPVAGSTTASAVEAAQEAKQKRINAKKDYFYHDDLPSRNGASVGEFVSTKGLHVAGNCNEAMTAVAGRKFVPMSRKRFEQRQKEEEDQQIKMEAAAPVGGGKDDGGAAAGGGGSGSSFAARLKARRDQAASQAVMRKREREM